MTPMAIEGREVVHAFVEHEHDELAAGIDRIHDAACDLTGLPASEIVVHVGDILRWVDETLRPHMAWEETWLFPQIDKRAQTPWATRLVPRSTIARSTVRPNSSAPIGWTSDTARRPWRPVTSDAT